MIDFGRINLGSLFPKTWGKPEIVGVVVGVVVAVAIIASIL